jgi:hypothetical protein
MANKANLDLLHALHKVTAEYYKGYLDIALADGEEVSSGMLAAVNTFLKNNNITVDVVESDSVMDLGISLRSLIKEEEFN